MNTIDIKEEHRDYNSKINAIEKICLALPQVECSVTHKFGPGIYIREVFLPKGSLIIGHHHNFEHMNIFVKGRMTMIYENGQEEIKAPLSYVSGPGRKKAYIHEDCIWLNVFCTTETDIEKLENHFLTKSDGFLEDKKEREKIIFLESVSDKRDYFNLLKELKLTETVVRSISENKEDMTTLPYGSYKFKTGQSKIEGTGLIATGDIEPFEVIAAARIGGKRTIAGRYTNHSANPNAKMIKGENNDIALIALKKIKGCHGGQDGEEITINYRDAFRLTLEIGGQKCLR